MYRHLRYMAVLTAADEDFRRFHYRSSGKVYREFLLYAIGRNLNKYHRFSTGKLKKYELKNDKSTA